MLENDDTPQATMVCPHCKRTIKLNESFAAPLIEATKKDCEQRLANKEADVSKREAAIKEQQEAVEKAKESVDEQVATQVATERTKIAAEEAKKARLILSTDIQQKDKQVADLLGVVKQMNEKLTVAQNAQADLIVKERELNDAKREMGLTIQKQVQESVTVIQEQARKEAEEVFVLKVADKDKVITDMKSQIAEMQRKAEQGSQQLQGEVQELHLETILRGRFPTDLIEPVSKGEHGGDVLHHVHGPLGQVCGTILWESKRTKTWIDGWLPKMREDQLAAKAEYSILVSQALPKNCETFDLVGGVWVTSMRCALALAVVLRQSMMELATARKTGEGQQTKMEMVYTYLMGPLFRQRVEAIVGRFSEMEEDLAKEKRSMTRAWSKREGQIRIALDATAGMYGDLQGIAGQTLQEVEGLKLLTDSEVNEGSGEAA